jgi:putative acetyltransferase
MSNICIREIQAKDNIFVNQLVVDVLAEHGAIGSGYAMADEELKDMYQSYQLQGKHYYVVEENGILIGGAGIAPLDGEEDSGICELRKMYFSSNARGKGIGKQLIDECIKKAIELGYSSIYLETMKKMQAAQKLYKSRGFVYLDHRMGNTGHHSCPVFMLKTLE